MSETETVEQITWYKCEVCGEEYDYDNLLIFGENLICPICDHIQHLLTE
jgi:DNA-directed RNA polymerase subunit RPC12/RpoP